jgi:hypothetical protein
MFLCHESELRELAKRIDSLPPDSPVRRWVDIHLVSGWAAKGMYPINFLRNIALHGMRSAAFPSGISIPCRDKDAEYGPQAVKQTGPHERRIDTLQDQSHGWYMVLDIDGMISSSMHATLSDIATAAKQVGHCASTAGVDARPPCLFVVPSFQLRDEGLHFDFKSAFPSLYSEGRLNLEGGWNLEGVWNVEGPLNVEGRENSAGMTSRTVATAVQWPSDKRALRELVYDKEQVEPMHKGRLSYSGPLRHDAWLHSDTALSIEYHAMFEPYYIAR